MSDSIENENNRVHLMLEVMNAWHQIPIHDPVLKETLFAGQRFIILLSLFLIWYKRQSC